ncbi:hypothetical protein VNO77_02556 [Canavalia gladiata]|uniref:Uncharacterized protein n=1 Tax=Canavalia gladiata TaxID=3824 RepID=A0AAN9MT49_CANGL
MTTAAGKDQGTLLDQLRFESCKQPSLLARSITLVSCMLWHYSGRESWQFEACGGQYTDFGQNATYFNHFNVIRRHNSEISDPF